jgi:membrane protease subunit HflK
MSWDWDKLKKQQKYRDGGGATVPPQMDEVVQKIKKVKLPGGPLIGLVIIAVVVYSVFFTIKTGQVGVVQRFGKYVRSVGPGLNFKLPIGIEKVTKVNEEILRIQEFKSGFEQIAGRPRFTPEADAGNVSLMLTGDLNVALVPWVVQYKVKDPYNWLFKVADVDGLLRDMSEATVRLVVGDRSVNEVIKREGIEEEVKEFLQKELDEAQTGIHIVGIKLAKTNVPRPVQPSFNEVNQAVQEKEKMIYEAKEDYNKAIPAAKGEAERTIKTAEGYALDRVNRAKGDAAKFLSRYNEYAKAKDVTKRRLYLEMLGDLFPKMGPKYIIDSDQKNLLPFLNLERENILKSTQKSGATK